jgi:hypothetical protein
MQKTKKDASMHSVLNMPISIVSIGRNFDASKCPDVKPWVAKAISEEEEKPNGLLWENEPSKESRTDNRVRLIKFLYKYEKQSPVLRSIIGRLELCQPKNRCCSGACPECGRLLQRWFVRRSKRIIENAITKNHQLIAISIIPSRPIMRPGQLAELSLINFQRRLKSALDKIDLGAAIGGIDFSFNEDRDDEYLSFWCPHFYLITSTSNRMRLKRLLQQHFKRDFRIPRPIKIADFDNSPGRRSYAYKIEFFRRIGYNARKTNQDGTTRKCRETSRDKLRAAARLELIAYLDQCGLDERFVFRGVKPVVGSNGVCIRII